MTAIEAIDVLNQACKSVRTDWAGHMLLQDALRTLSPVTSQNKSQNLAKNILDSTINPDQVSEHKTLPSASS